MGHHRNDFDDLSAKYGHVLFGNSLCIEFVACWDSLQNWSRIIDFRNGSGDSNIYIANKGTTNTFVFSVRNGTTWSAIELTNFINIGATSRYLCVVTPEGLMSVYRDDLLVGEARKARGVSPGCRKYLYVGRSNWKADSYFLTHQCRPRWVSTAFSPVSTPWVSNAIS